MAFLPGNLRVNRSEGSDPGGFRFVWVRAEADKAGWALYFIYHYGA